jgi:hypothetical protein
MDARDLLLEEHSAMHSAAVGGNKASMAERTFAGLTDDQMRVRPREDLNSLAWIMWHIARAEDIMANVIVNGRNQVFDDGWAPRLKIARPEFGIGMSKTEAAGRSGAVDIAAWDYPDAVGRARARRGRLRAKDWEGEVRRPRPSGRAPLAASARARRPLVRGHDGPAAPPLSSITIMHPPGTWAKAHRAGGKASARV